MSVALEHRKVLVLNKNWNPIGFASMKKAMTLLFKEEEGLPKAQILDAGIQNFVFDEDEKTLFLTIPELPGIVRKQLMRKNRVSMTFEEMIKVENMISDQMKVCVDPVRAKALQCLDDKFLERAIAVEEVADKFRLYTWDDWSAIRPSIGDDGIIHLSGGRTLKLPEIILLTHNDGIPHDRNNFSRRMIYRRDDGICQYCQCKVPTTEATIDHIIPKCAGGLTNWTNCVTCCVSCNSQKANRLLGDARKEALSREQQKKWRGPSPMKLLKQPVKPKHDLLKGDRIVHLRSWEQFMSESYWGQELENDM